MNSAHSANSGKNPDQSTYEAVTGESADEDKSFWDSFYKKKDHAFGRDAVAFLRENLSKIPKGKAFVPAMGEGRNAVFIAKHGFDVIGNDISDVAVDKARVLAKNQNVKMQISVEDLKQYRFIDQEFDFIFLSLFYDKSLVPSFKKTLKKGGYIMLYQEVYDGDPKKAPSPFWVRSKELAETFKDFKMILYKEFNEHGKRMVGMLAQKNG